VDRGGAAAEPEASNRPRRLRSLARRALRCRVHGKYVAHHQLGGRALFAALPAILEEGGVLVAYGPFKYGGAFTSASNAAFDVWLKQRAAHSGVRDFEAVDALAHSSGMTLLEDRPMPAHNRALIWRKLECCIDAGCAQ
jgi:hypothetical protein